MKSTTGICIGVLGLGMMTAACGSENSSAPQTKTITRQQAVTSAFTPAELETTVNDLVAAINAAKPATMQLNVILKEVSPYFQPVVIGANRAMGELQTTGSVAAPGTSDPDAGTVGQVAMISQDVTQGALGIGVAPLNESLVPSINSACSAGIPVVTIDSDLADSNRDLYIGTINSAAGTTAGNTLLKYLHGGSGTVAILGQGDMNWPDGYNRTMAAVNVLQAAGYTTSVVTATWSDMGATDAASMANIFATANPPVVGMMGMFADAYECAQAAQVAGKMAGDIPIVAFDFDPNTVAFMKSGYIQATHAQRQYYMGYLTPYVLYGMKVLGMEKTKQILAPQMVDQYSFNTGLDVVAADQLDAYSAFLDQLGIGGN